MSYTPEQPDPLVFFIDRSLGKKTIADALKQEGAIILGIPPQIACVPTSKPHFNLDYCPQPKLDETD